LVGCEVAFFSVAIEVWRNREFANGIKDLRKGNVIIAPVKYNLNPSSAIAFALCGEHDLGAMNVNVSFELALFPLF
jgi:hypothetical protein